MDKEQDIDNQLYKYLSPDLYCYVHNYIVDLKMEMQQQINNLNKFIKEYGNYLDSLHLDDKGIVYRAREKWNLLLKGIDRQ